MNLKHDDKIQITAPFTHPQQATQAELDKVIALRILILRSTADHYSRLFRLLNNFARKTLIFGVSYILPAKS